MISTAIIIGIVAASTLTLLLGLFFVWRWRAEANKIPDYEAIQEQFDSFCSTARLEHYRNLAAAKALIDAEWERVSLVVDPNTVEALLKEMGVPEGAQRSRIVAQAKEAEEKVNV